MIICNPILLILISHMLNPTYMTIIDSWNIDTGSQELIIYKSNHIPIFLLRELLRDGFGNTQIKKNIVVEHQGTP